MNRKYPIWDNPTFKMHSSMMSKCHLNDLTKSSYRIRVNFVFLIFEDMFFVVEYPINLNVFVEFY